MNLLGAKLYDPAGVVTKATSALLAMTAFDTTNLRLTVTVPAHGILRFKIQCAIYGATTFPQILLGCLVGSTVTGRIAPQVRIGGTNIATTRAIATADYTIGGLTPGSTVFDAAYGVEIVIAATNIRYGGPNDTTTNNAWGGFLFEIWDPQPQGTGGQLSVDSSGRVILQPTQTGVTIPTVTTLTNLPSIPSNWLTAAGINDSAFNGKGDWNVGKTGYALSSAGIQAVWDALTSALTTANSVGKLLVDNINATISSRSTYAGADTSGTTTLLSRIIGTLVTGTHQPQTGDSFALANGANGFVATKADTAAVKAQTDQLAFTVANQVDSNALSGGSSGLDAAGVRAALGMASANLDTQLDALPTNAELATALDGADDATLAAIAALNNLSSAQAQTAAAAALTAYGPPTRAEATSDKDALITEVNANETKIDTLQTAIDAVPTAIENADTLLKRDWTGMTGEAARSMLNALRFIRNKFSTTANPGFVTVYKEDDTTEAFTKPVTTDVNAAPIIEG